MVSELIKENMHMKLYMEGTVNNHHFKCTSEGEGKPYEGTQTMRIKAVEGGPLPFAFDILATSFMYGSKTFINHTQGIPDFFKQSFPEGFTWERVTTYEDGGVLTATQDTSLQDGCLIYNVKIRGVNFPSNGPVMQKKTLGWEASTETLYPADGGLEGRADMALKLVGGGHLICNLKTTYRSKKPAKNLKMPGVYYVDRRLERIKEADKETYVEQHEVAVARYCDLPSKLGHRDPAFLYKVVDSRMKDNTVPLKLIALLANGEFHSGEQLGETLGMSRAAINKHIQTLRDWGVDVFTVPGKGYSLPEPIQLLNAKQILGQLDGGSVAVLPVIDSTNQYLLDRIGELKSGDACIAEYQQAGRGGRGRKWFSPFGANLYLSMFWRLEQGPAAAIGLSLVIGIVMAEVLRKLGADKVRVKWPNDLYLQDRKLAGILVELTGKTGDAAQIVIGAGINMAMRRVEESVVNQGWITLQEAGINLDRNTLAAMLIRELRAALELFEQEGLAPYLSRWEKLDNFINRPVKLIIGDKEIFGISRGIDKQGALLLEQDGIIKPWMGGEISLRSAEKGGSGPGGGAPDYKDDDDK
nr:mKate2-BirA*-Flag [Respiratory syncytial virus]